MVVSAAYTVTLDLRDGLVSDPLVDITEWVSELQISWGMGDVSAEIAPPSRCVIDLRDINGQFNPDDPTADYVARIWRGQVVTVTMTDGGDSSILYKGKVVSREYVERPYEPRIVRLTLSDQMSRLAAAYVNLPLLEEVRVDEVITKVFERGPALWPYDYRYFTIGSSRLGDSPTAPAPRDYENVLLGPSGYSANLATEEARTRLTWAGDLEGRDTSALDFIREVVATEGGGRFYWDAPNGRFQFVNRWHDSDSYTRAITLTGSELEYVDGLMDGDLVNDATVTYRPRTTSASVTLLYDAPSPIELVTGEVLDLVVRYQDPTAPSAECAGVDCVAVLGTDIIVNTQPNGGGVNVTQQIYPQVEFNATSARVRIANESSANLWVSKLQIRGRPLSLYNRQQVSYRDNTSVLNYDYSPISRTLEALDDRDLAMSMARQLVNTRRLPRKRYEVVRFHANDSQALLTAARTLTIGDGVGVTYRSHDTEYSVMHIKHTITPGERIQHHVELMLKDVLLQPWFILGQSELGGPDVLAF